MFSKTNILKISLGIAIGGVLGYAYYAFLGCRSGCPITSNWVTSVLYGSIFGAIIMFPSKRSKNERNN